MRRQSPAWPFGLAFVSVERAVPGVRLPLFLQGCNMLPGFRSGTFHPSGSSLLLQKHATSKAPSLHASPTLPGFPGSSTDLSTRAAPNHPGKLNEYMPIASPLMTGFIPVGGLATFRFLTRPNRVHLRCGSRVCPYQGFTRWIARISRSLGYMYEQAIYMVNTFQFTRSARLILAHRPKGAVVTNLS